MFSTRFFKGVPKACFLRKSGILNPLKCDLLLLIREPFQAKSEALQLFILHVYPFIFKRYFHLQWVFLNGFALAQFQPLCVPTLFLPNRQLNGRPYLSITSHVNILLLIDKMEIIPIDCIFYCHFENVKGKRPTERKLRIRKAKNY